MTYTQKCGRCGQNWSGYGVYCNDCQRMDLLKEANALQEENMREQQRDRDRADQRRRDDREIRREQNDQHQAACNRELSATLNGYEITHPGMTRAYYLQQDMRSKAFNAAHDIAESNQQLKIKNARIVNVICWLAVFIIGIVYYAPWTTDWMPLKLVGLVCYVTAMMTSFAQTYYPMDFDYEDGAWRSGIPSIGDVYKKMLEDDAKKAAEVKRIADENLLPLMPGTNIPAKERKEPIF